MKTKWNLKTIILMTLTALICGVIYWLISFLYTILAAILTPLGLAPMANDLTQGPWILAGTLIGCMFQMPGSAFFGQFLSSIIETFIGDKGGIMDAVSGIFDGIGTELGFMITGYRKYNHWTLALTSLLTTITTFGYSWLFDGYRFLGLGILSLLFCVRFASIFIVSDFLTLGIIKLLKRSGALGMMK
ncbi:ECF transporter S component [Nicoliella spurrieriana]|uniref:ECF transporter S component n=1 Tax=Nicoliella spurrieriana TaxID=2925830 RepID=A0A976X5G8_9LACO|nr:ECF transporter S component [Nicoliella spurrieriana]UQS86938.1 ECF transporter S component [Nicoliella spurrieriana]